jgi:hypothetical protein
LTSCLPILDGAEFAFGGDHTIASERCRRSTIIACLWGTDRTPILASALRSDQVKSFLHNRLTGVGKEMAPETPPLIYADVDFDLARWACRGVGTRASCCESSLSFHAKRTLGTDESGWVINDIRATTEGRASIAAISLASWRNPHREEASRRDGICAFCVARGFARSKPVVLGFGVIGLGALFIYFHDDPWGMLFASVCLTVGLVLIAASEATGLVSKPGGAKGNPEGTKAGPNSGSGERGSSCLSAARRKVPGNSRSGPNWLGVRSIHLLLVSARSSAVSRN